MKSLIPILLFISCLVFGQEKTNYIKEMISSGEVENMMPTKNVSYAQNDYPEFKKAKAWQSKANSIFSNPKDLDLLNIGGRVRSSLVDTNNNIALVAPSGGGIWKFNATNGTPFTPVDDFGSFMAVTYITQNPNNPQHIIIGTGDEKHYIPGNGLFESFNGGDTFNPIASTNPNNNNAFNFIRFVKFSPSTANTLYMAAGDKLYRSEDLGANWTLVFDANNRITSLDFTSNTGVIVSVLAHGIYASPTGDTSSFSILSNGVRNGTSGNNPSTYGVVLASHHANRDIVYALFADNNDENKEIYKTTNGGTSWTRMGDPTFYITSVWFALTIGVHPTNPDIITAGSIAWGYSDDGGATWVKGETLEVDYHDIHFHPSNPDVAYVGYDQGLGRVDFGNYVNITYWDWETQQYVNSLQPEGLELGKKAGFNTTQIYYGDYYPEAYGDAYIEGQQDGGCFAKVNGIETRIRVGDGGSIFINKQDPNKAFASTQYGRLSKTSSALQPSYSSYSDVDGFLNNHPHFITQFSGNNADGNQLYMASNTSIQMTTNNADSFSSIATNDLMETHVAVENSLNPVVYAIGAENSGVQNTSIMRIANATTTASMTKHTDMLINGTDGRTDRISIDPNNKNTIYVATDNGKAFKFSNLDTNSPIKTDIKGDIQGVNFNIVIGVENQADLLIAGTNIGLFYSTNGGTTWTLSNEIPYTQVTDLKLRASDNRLFIFTHGRGAWATTVSNTPLSTNDEKLVDISIYPNPTSESIHITSKTNSVYDVFLFDAKGNRVISTSNTSKLDVSHLSTGSYILHALVNGTISAVQKIVIE